MQLDPDHTLSPEALEALDGLALGEAPPNLHHPPFDREVLSWLADPSEEDRRRRVVAAALRSSVCRRRLASLFRAFHALDRHAAPGLGAAPRGFVREAGVGRSPNVRTKVESGASLR